MGIIDILVVYHQGLLDALGVTLHLSIIIWTTGILIGGMIGIIGSRSNFINMIIRNFSFLLSGLPVLVLLFWFHYPLQAVLNIVIDPFYTAATVLSLINVFAVSDLVNRVLRDFPTQYLDAAKVSGLNGGAMIFYIQLPIIFRQILPGIISLQVVMLQSTLFASLISVDEIFRMAQRINAQIYRPVEIYSALGVLFLLICLPINGLSSWLRIKFTRNVSER